MLQTAETFRHETLLNLAFAGVPVWWLLYPYDTTSLSVEVLDEGETELSLLEDDSGEALPQLGVNLSGLELGPED